MLNAHTTFLSHFNPSLRTLLNFLMFLSSLKLYLHIIIMFSKTLIYYATLRALYCETEGCFFTTINTIVINFESGFFKKYS